MTYRELAAKYKMTLDQLWAARGAYVEQEGYDEDGREYNTLEAWVGRGIARLSYEPVDGGRGVGDYGNG